MNSMLQVIDQSLTMAYSDKARRSHVLDSGLYELSSQSAPSFKSPLDAFYRHLDLSHTDQIIERKLESYHL